MRACAMRDNRGADPDMAEIGYERSGSGMTGLRRDPPGFPSPRTFPRLRRTRRRMSGGVVWVQPPATRITLGREMAGFTAVLVLHGFNSAATIGKHGCHRPPTAGWRAP